MFPRDQRADGGEVLDIRRERFFDIDGFIGLEGLEDVAGVGIVAGGDHDRVDIGVAEDFAGIGGGEGHLVLARHGRGGDAGGSADADEADIGLAGEGGEEEGLAEVAGADDAEADGARRAVRKGAGSHRYDAGGRGGGGILRVADDHADLPRRSCPR